MMVFWDDGRGEVWFKNGSRIRWWGSAGTTNGEGLRGPERLEPPVHVVPVKDLREHETERGADCWCEPRVEFEEGSTGLLIIHEALDGRA